MLPNLGRLSLQQADTRVVFRYNDKEYWDERYPQINDDRCAICLEEIKRNDSVAVLSCTHFFHEACIREWVVREENCPTCRKPIISKVAFKKIKGPLTPEESFLEAAEEGDLAKVTQMLKDGIDVNAHDEDGKTALMWACANEHAIVALALLERKDINVNLVNKYDNTALHWASLKGMLEVVEKLIEKGADVNKQNEDGYTALIGACDKGMLEVVEKLIENGADVNVQDEKGYTALTRVCDRKHTDVALALLKRKDIEVDLADEDGHTALHKASEKGMLEVVKKLIEKGADVNSQTRIGYTALMIACYMKQADVALALLESKDIDVNVQANNGETALHQASRYEMLSIVEDLIEKRADVNKQNEDGYTALFWACFVKNTDIAFALLESKNIDVDLANVVGNTALHQASYQGMLAVVKKLIEKRADVNKQNRNGNTALIWACENEQADVARALLESKDIKVDLANEYGHTALHKASEKGMLVVVEKLIEKRADANKQDKEGNTALIWACFFNHTVVALALLNVDGIEVDLANDVGNTALHQASVNGMLSVVEKLIEKGADANKQDKDGYTALIAACYADNTDIALALLKSKDIEVNLMNSEGKTALHQASRQGMLSVVEKLIEKRANANKQDEDGDTALIRACIYRNTDVALALLESKDIEVDLANNKGKTALHEALKKRMLEVAKKLIEKGADVNAQDEDGQTALHLASRQGMLEVVEKLIEKRADVNKQDKDGHTALMHACDNEHTHVALALLNDDGIEVDLVNIRGETALQWASFKGMLEVVEKLIAKDADVNVQNENGTTALIVACVRKHTDVALALLEDDNIEVDLANEYGNTALNQASENGMTEVVERIREIQSTRASNDARRWR